MKKPKTLIVWYSRYSPFQMGGSVVHIRQAEAPIVANFTKRGYRFACVQVAPTAFQVASLDAEGALVSARSTKAEDAIAAVKQDVAAGELEVMNKQITTALDMLQTRPRVMVPLKSLHT